MKIAKFGGSSLANGEQIKKVGQIVKNDPEIRYVVVSAPGKRNDKDIKVTDLLINLYLKVTRGDDYSEAIATVLQRYQSIINDLEIETDLMSVISQRLTTYIETIKDEKRLLDAIKSSGEDFNAMLVSKYFKQIGINAHYVSPKDAGICVSDEPSQAHLLEESYDLIQQRIGNYQGVAVIPGFFGYSKNNHIVTFPRGGSDITGAIVARGVGASVYENFTDESFIYSAHPNIISQPHPIKEITYAEMRELAYSGFGIFHDEALEPLYKVEIPVRIRNTNDPHNEGTLIVPFREDIRQYPVIGLSVDEGFTAITVRSYLLNRKIGYMRRLLQIFEEQQISVEHIPTGIDDISIIVRSHRLPDRVMEIILDEIDIQLDPDSVSVETNLAMLAVVGEGMRSITGLANKATEGLAENNINIRMINQGASELSMFFAIQIKDSKKAIKSIYPKYFSN